MVDTRLRRPDAVWAGAEPVFSQPPTELKRRSQTGRPIRHLAEEKRPPWPDRGDWWRVAAMVAAVLCGSALALYALIQWAAGM